MSVRSRLPVGDAMRGAEDISMCTVEQVCWFAARTRPGQELMVRDRLRAEGVDHYIPTIPKRTAPRKEKVVVARLVFFRTTKSKALALSNTGTIPVKYIVDCSTHTLLIVPDKQLEDFRRVLDLSLREGGLVDRPLSYGDPVRVAKGPLRGVKGNVIEFRGRYYVSVSLLGSVFASAHVPRSWLEAMKPRE